MPEDAINRDTTKVWLVRAILSGNQWLHAPVVKS
jgi:hypothetical protein